MLELSNRRFNGDFEKYRDYIKRVRPHIEKSIVDGGWKITCNVFDVDGTVTTCDRVRHYDKIMCLSVEKDGTKLFTEVKKSTYDRHDGEFMYGLAIYRIWNEIKKHRNDANLYSNVAYSWQGLLHQYFVNG